LASDPNYFAVYQVASLAPALALAALTRKTTGSTLVYLAAMAIVLSIVASQSRAGLIILGVGMIASIVLPTRIFFGRVRQKLGYVTTLIVTAAFVAYAAPAAFLARAGTLTNALGTNGDRGSGRLDFWRAAWTGFTEHPWFGLGAGNFRARSLDLFQSTPGVDTSKSYIYAGRVVHNIYLETLAELGVVGFVLFMAVLVWTAVYLRRSARRARASGRPDLARFATVFGSMLGVYVLFGFFLSIELSKLLWIIIGVALSLDVITRRAQEAQAGRPPLPEPA
jgi:O-antigen ligase